MDSRTLVRIAMCVAGVIRTSKEMMVFELPYAKGLDAYKLDVRLPPRSKEVLNKIIKDRGGKRFKVDDDHLRFEVPYEEAQELEVELKDWAKLDKGGAKLLRVNKIVQYPEDRAVGPLPPVPGPAPEPKAKRVPPPSRGTKERGVRDERPGAPGKGGKPREKGAPADGKGFRVEIPVNLRGLVRRLQGNPHIKSLMEDFGGRPVKGDGLVMEFPDRKRRSEVLDEVSDAIQSSGFLREVLDTAEV